MRAIHAVMKNKMIVAALLTATAAGPAWAISEENDFGMVGITVGQTARLNVVNPGVPARAGRGSSFRSAIVI